MWRYSPDRHEPGGCQRRKHRTIDSATDSPRVSEDSVLGAEAAVADAFIRPFEYALPVESGLVVTTASASMYAFTHGSAESYSDTGYEDVSDVWGITATWASPARTHEGGGRDTLKLRPDSFFDDLRRNDAVSVGSVRPDVLGGFDALSADVRGQFNPGSGGYPDLHMDGSALVALAFPGRLIVVDMGGASFVVHIWAASEEELAAWLPMATQIAASIRFTEGE